MHEHHIKVACIGEFSTTKSSDTQNSEWNLRIKTLQCRFESCFSKRGEVVTDSFNIVVSKNITSRDSQQVSLLPSSERCLLIGTSFAQFNG